MQKLAKQLHLQILLFLSEDDLISCIKTCHFLLAFHGHKQLNQAIIHQRHDKIDNIFGNFTPRVLKLYSVQDFWLENMLKAVYLPMPRNQRAFHFHSDVFRGGKTTVICLFIRALLRAHEYQYSIVVASASELNNKHIMDELTCISHYPRGDFLKPEKKSTTLEWVDGSIKKSVSFMIWSKENVNLKDFDCNTIVLIDDMFDQIMKYDWIQLLGHVRCIFSTGRREWWQEWKGTRPWPLVQDWKKQFEKKIN